MGFKKIIFLAIGVIFFSARISLAEPLGSRPLIFVNKEVKVNSNRILLGEIARIINGENKYLDRIQAIKKIDLGESPAPQTTIVLLGEKVLASIKEAGIQVDDFGYFIPKEISIERNGRVITNAELIEVVRSSLANDPRDLKVKDVILTENQIIPTGEAKFSVQYLGNAFAGRLPIRAEVEIQGKQVSRFLATAIVDDWRNIPVINKSLDRGQLISADDVEMLRLNLAQQSEDVILGLEDIVGRRVKTRLTAGETVRKRAIDVPPVIPRGKRVTMLYSSAGLRASATGVALEDGFSEGKIKVRNENSKKIITAKVLDAEQVEIEVK